jgi:hypothetical protein
LNLAIKNQREKMLFEGADKDFRQKPEAWRGTKLYAIASGARRIQPNRLPIRQMNPSISL